MAGGGILRLACSEVQTLQPDAILIANPNSLFLFLVFPRTASTVLASCSD